MNINELKKLASEHVKNNDILVALNGSNLFNFKFYYECAPDTFDSSVFNSGSVASEVLRIELKGELEYRNKVIEESILKVVNGERIK